MMIRFTKEEMEDLDKKDYALWVYINKTENRLKCLIKIKEKIFKILSKQRKNRDLEEELADCYGCLYEGVRQAIKAEEKRLRILHQRKEEVEKEIHFLKHE
ncbi:MAG: hypothetical protein IJV12_00360 [Acidaminococcaceae bacterium]|nr:hypothetical protein [Acidaminococcaceae bacterium]